MAPHDHGDSGAAVRRRLTIALLLASVTAMFEVAGGIVTGSLALLADAGHMIGDAGALAMAIAAVWFAARPHTLRWTFGFHRAEVLAATANAMALFVIAGFILWHAVARMRDPVAVDAMGLTAVALVGLAVNALQLWILRDPRGVNVRAARLHVLADLGGSLAAVAAGVATALTDQPRFDSLLSVVIVALILFGATRLLRETVAILMGAVPDEIDLADVEAALLEVPGVLAIHDLHCWSVTSGFIALICHLEVSPVADAARVVRGGAAVVRSRFAIEHVTIQPEVAQLHDPLLTHPSADPPEPR